MDFTKHTFSTMKIIISIITYRNVKVNTTTTFETLIVVLRTLLFYLLQTNFSMLQGRCALTRPEYILNKTFSFTIICICAHINICTDTVELIIIQYLFILNKIILYRGIIHGRFSRHEKLKLRPLI